MASQSAIISIGFSRSVTAAKGGAGSASLQCGALQYANAYLGGSGLIARPRATYKLPSAQVPFARLPDGTPLYLERSWYDALNYVCNTQLGGITGPSLSDITTTVDSTRSSAIDAQNAVSVVAQTVNANADTLAATVQVAQTNSLSGSTQIPPVTFTRHGIEP